MAFIRDFTSETKEVLFSNILEEESRGTFGDYYVMDGISDFFEIDRVKYDSDKANQYYNYIVDEKNCAKPKIESIWQDVNKVDYDMARQVERITDIANALQNKIQLIYDIVSGGSAADSKLMYNLNDFKELFAGVDAVATTMTNNELEKLIIRKEDGTYEYDWDYFKGLMAGSPEDLNTNEYLALISMVEMIGEENDDANMERFLENSYIEQDGVYRYYMGDFRCEKLSPVFVELSGVYDEKVKELLKYSYTDADGTSINFLKILMNGDLGAVTEEQKTILEMLKKETTNNTLLKTVMLGMNEFYIMNTLKVDFTINRVSEDYDDIQITSENQNQSIMIPYSVAPLVVHEFMSAESMDTIDDANNASSLLTIKQDTLIVDQSVEAVSEYVRDEVLSDIASKAALNMSSKIAGAIVKEGIGITFAAVTAAYDITSSEIEACRVNKIIDNVIENTATVNFMAKFHIEGNWSYAGDKMIVSNQYVNSVELGISLADFYTASGKDLSIETVNNYLHGKDIGTEQDEIIKKFYNWREK